VEKEKIPKKKKRITGTHVEKEGRCKLYMTDKKTAFTNISGCKKKKDINKGIVTPVLCLISTGTSAAAAAAAAAAIEGRTMNYGSCPEEYEICLENQDR
jgi:hypothetical protein